MNIAIVGALTEGEYVPNDMQLAFHFLEELSESDLLFLFYKWSKWVWERLSNQPKAMETGFDARSSWFQSQGPTRLGRTRANTLHLLTLCSGPRSLTQPSFSSALFLTKHNIVQASNPTETKKWNVNCIKSLNFHSHTPIITTSLTDRRHRERGRNWTVQVLASPIPGALGKAHTVQGTNVKTVPNP